MLEATEKKVSKHSEQEVLVKCDNCEKKFYINEAISERIFPRPYHTVTQGYMTCPHCKHYRHLYFLSAQTKQIRANLYVAIDNFNRRRTQANAHLVKTVRISHQRSYDKDQDDLKYLLEKVNENGELAT